LLTILALMKRQGVTLPEHRVELYEQYVKTLLSSWNRARGLGRPPTYDLDPVQTVKILAPLALWMHETNRGVGLVKREDLQRELETIYRGRGDSEPETSAHQFLNDIRKHTGLLVERGPGEYGFIHLTFEEYLAAVAIALQGQGDVQRIASTLAAHVGEPAWYEIILLTVGYVGLIQQMDKIAGTVVETLIKTPDGPPGAAVALAAEAVVDAWPAGVTLASKQRAIDGLLASFPNAATVGNWRGRAGRALAVLGDPRRGVGMRDVPDVVWVRIPGTADVRDSGRFPGFTGLRLGNGTKQDPEAGSNETWPKGTPPLNIVGFYLAAYSVTVAQFRPFVKQGYREDHWWSEAGRHWRGSRVQPYLWGDPAWTLDNHPVVRVTWYDAEAYCNWLNAQLRLLPGTIRLPTEAEWEWVARGPEGRRYPWGDEWQSWRCNSCESGIDRTSAVGCFPGGATDWWQAIQSDDAVVHDLAGNVWEWTASEYTEDYQGDHQSGLNANRFSSGPRVLRGGSWDSVPGRLRGAARYGSPADFGTNYRGFRLASTILSSS
jgi:formylglycine-generating enzyme required for sulfatase activity